MGKLALSLEFKEWIEQALKQLDAAALPITVEYVDAQRKLPQYHGDPFDRLLVAQAQVEGIPIVSADPVLDKYGTQRIW
ncbi:MAG: type II toxin-antitoxin system VapC family toxin [Acidobacteriota bacterium]